MAPPAPQQPLPVRLFPQAQKMLRQPCPDLTKSEGTAGRCRFELSVRFTIWNRITGNISMPATAWTTAPSRRPEHALTQHQPSALPTT